MKLVTATHRDGTSQRMRMLPAHSPEYFSIDERSLEDLLAFAQRYAKELKFYTNENIAQGDWQAFLPNQEFLADVIKFIKAPDSFENPSRFAELAEPHRVLFYTFLQLLRYPQQQFKDLTRRYLDFYYRDYLRLREQPQQPDKVHVVFHLAENQSHYLLSQGTLLNAGEDAAGHALYYSLDKDIILNQASIAQVKTLAIKKATANVLAVIHEQYNKSALGFEKILEWALGQPQQKDLLPAHPDGSPGNILSLKALYQRIKDQEISEISEEDRIYITDSLNFLVVEDFKFCLQMQLEEEASASGGNVTAEQWQQVYMLVEKAYQKRLTVARRLVLEQIYQSQSFDNMLKFALGEPNAGDSLPAFPNNYLSLAALAEAAQAQDSAAIEYITERLFMTTADFVTVMQKKLIIDNTPSTDPAYTTALKEIVRLVERAQSKKRQFIYPSLAIEKIASINAQSILDVNDPGLSSFKRFKAFGELSDTMQTTGTIVSLGFAVQSPLLFLREGERQILLTIACREQGFDLDALHSIIRLQNSPFHVYLSGAEQWLQAENFTVQSGNFIMGETITEYSAAELFLLASTVEENLLQETDIGHYLQFKDGSLYEIIDLLEASHTLIKLSAVGKLPASGQLTKYTALTWEWNVNVAGASLSALAAEELESGNYSINSQCLTTEEPSFITADIDSFIIDKEGALYAVIKVVTATKLIVEKCGYLPAFASNNFQKFAPINLQNPSIIAAPLAITAIGSNTDSSFASNDKGNFLLWNNGKLFTINSLINPNEVAVTNSGEISSTGLIKKYPGEALFLRSLQFKINLNDQLPAIMTPQTYTVSEQRDSKAPFLKVMLKNSQFYDYLRQLEVEKINITVDVQTVKNLYLRNEEGVLDVRTPFQPFGYEPKKRSSLYLANDEICYKPINKMVLHLTWMGLPELIVDDNNDCLANHYDAYSKLLNLTINHQSFKSQLKQINSSSINLIAGDKELFAMVDNQLSETNSISWDLTADNSAMQISSFAEQPADPVEWRRYFKLELSGMDFQHGAYAVVMNKIGMAKEDDTIEEGSNDLIKDLTAYPPYTPILQNISVDYSATLTSDIAALTAEKTAALIQMAPFGEVAAAQIAEINSGNEKICYLMPQFNATGQLYIGIQNLQTPATLSILFQIIIGDGDDLLNKPNLQWSYLSENHWLDFTEAQLLYDTTNDLVNRGIITFALPEAVTNTNTLMPAGFCWLRVISEEENSAIEILEIHTQAASATLQTQEDVSQHLSKPLAPYSIQQLVISDNNIKEIIQPMSSFGGKPRETGENFWIRASERLRHKQRALTRWDYEHLVLEAFSQIYKVKCLTPAEQPEQQPISKVSVVVVADIAHTKPFFPLEPRVPAYLLEEIKNYLKKHTSPFVEIDVKNPRYEEIKYRIAARFNQQSERGYYLNQLNEDIKRFLSPWAYSEQADIAFGSYIHHSQLIAFIDRLPYVDNVAKVTLVEQKLFNRQTNQVEVFSDAYGSDIAKVHYPDSILVSSPQHIIDIINDDEYQEQYFEGIGYMMIGVDFYVS